MNCYHDNGYLEIKTKVLIQNNLEGNGVTSRDYGNLLTIQSC